MNQYEDNQTTITDRKLIGDIRWVMLAMGDKYESRKSLCYLHVVNGKLLATDGHRIHAIPNTWIPEGSYYVDVNRKTKMILVKSAPKETTLPGSFEETIFIALKNPAGRLITLDNFSPSKQKLMAYTDQTQPFLFARLYRKLQYDYNYRYLADVLPAIETTATVIRESKEQLYIQGERREAVVLRLRI